MDVQFGFAVASVGAIVLFFGIGIACGYKVGSEEKKDDAEYRDRELRVNDERIENLECRLAQTEHDLHRAHKIVGRYGAAMTQVRNIIESTLDSNFSRTSKP